MSEVSARAEHLIRAAMIGIKKEPLSWDQVYWVRTPDDFRALGKEVPACGTTYCLGGWMMLYDGWKHISDPLVTNAWIKGDMKIRDPFTEYLSTLIGLYEGPEDFDSTIFSTSIKTIPDLIARIEEDLEINFEEDCPCITESDVCTLKSCPCGVHTTSVKIEVDAAFKDEGVFLTVIEDFVKEAQEAGDRITVRQVLADPIMMAAFRAMFLAGNHALIDTVISKANRRIEEGRAALAEMTASRDRVIARNSELQQQVGHEELKAQIADLRRDEVGLTLVIRKLQGQINDLKSGARQDPDVVKIKKKHEAATAHVHDLTLKLSESNKTVVALGDALRDQKAVARQLQAQIVTARQNGWRAAAAAWQEALNVIKKEENL